MIPRADHILSAVGSAKNYVCSFLECAYGVAAANRQESGIGLENCVRIWSASTACTAADSRMHLVHLSQRSLDSIGVDF